MILMKFGNVTSKAIIIPYEIMVPYIVMLVSIKKYENMIISGLLESRITLMVTCI